MKKWRQSFDCLRCFFIRTYWIASVGAAIGRPLLAGGAIAIEAIRVEIGGNRHCVSPIMNTGA